MHLNMETLVPMLTWGRLGLVALVTAPVAIWCDRRYEAWLLKKELKRQLNAGPLGADYENLFDPRRKR